MGSDLKAANSCRWVGCSGLTCAARCVTAVGEALECFAGWQGGERSVLCLERPSMAPGGRAAAGARSSVQAVFPCQPLSLSTPRMHWLRLAAAALALALGQSREEARQIITLKEVEPLIEAKYRCGVLYNSWTFGWLGVVLQLSSWSKSGTESRGWPLTAPKHGCSAGGREAGPPTGAHTPLSICLCSQRSQGQHQRRAAGRGAGAAARR